MHHLFHPTSFGNRVIPLLLALFTLGGLYLRPAPVQAGATPALIISEIVDATLPGGLPKFVELTNVGSTNIDLSQYSIGNYSNGATTLGGGASTVLSGILTPGASYVISYENGDSPGTGLFFDTYGFDPDNFDLGAFFNGDDVIALFQGAATGDGSDATLIDVYGVIGTDGTGEPWEYTDGYAFRNASVTSGNTVFTASEWTIGGPNSLETGDDIEETQLILAMTTPGIHGATQLLLSEIVVTPTGGEFIEIYNPGTAVFDLSNVYLTDATFTGTPSAFYYNIVTGSNAGGGGFGDFQARFPDGSSIAPGEYQTIALNGSANFMAEYGIAPTYELFDDSTANGEQVMREAVAGSISGQGGLSNNGEVVILYTWDGVSDLVTDLDYVLWGDKAEAVDKTGIAIDGPDADTDTSTYLADTATADQDVVGQEHAFGSSWQRENLREGAETKSGGNGANGHNETSEDLSNTWCESPTRTPNAATECPSDSGITLKIYEIQGNGATSPYAGQIVETGGIVVADFQGGDQLNGFFLQDITGDSDMTTSDGIFVYDPSGTDVAVGDVISVTALVDEFNTLTELKNLSSLTINSSGNPLPAPAQVTLPEATDGDLEQYEGMLVQITDSSNMVVAQNFFLGRYGQMTLSAGKRLYQPTNQEAPGSPAAQALAADNAKRLLILDDGQDINSLGDNPNPVPYIEGPPPAVIRAGDQVSNLIGVLDFGRINSSSEPARDYRLHPTVAPVFTPANLRTNAPDAVGGTLKVAAFNVLNYFTTIDQSGASCYPRGTRDDCRGADSASEFTRQRDKIVAALQAIDADIVGLVELENNAGAAPANDGTDPVLADLVGALNAVVGAGTYNFIDAGLIEAAVTDGDAIKVAFIYKPSTVTPVGAAALLDSSFDANFIDTKNRPALAQTFDENSSGARFTAVVNHLKSKGSACDDVGDPIDPDGQGNCNGTRTAAATVLAQWLATDPTGSGDPDFLILGDLNAYAMEDPITALKNAGYTDLINQFLGDAAYSYTFDGLLGYLDHALANSALLPQVTGVTQWHINTDEPAVINYDENFNPAGYYNADPFRASDHDPVIVGLNLTVPATDGTLSVTKIVINDDNGTATVTDFTLTIDNGSGPQTVDSGVANTVPAGVYQIAESGPPGYTATFGGDCNANGQVAVNVGESKSCTITNDDNPPLPTDVIYLSTQTNGRIGDLRFRDEDILTFDTTTNSWGIYFDGSDVGVGKADVDAFHLLNDGSILMSFDKAMRMFLINEFQIVDDSDIVRFIPTQIGEDTAGSFELFFVGYDAGLERNGEDIDALGIDASGNLVVSTIGTLRVGDLKLADEDLAVIDSVSNALSLFFDGSDVALTRGSEDVTSLFIQGDKLYLTTKGPFRAESSSNLLGNAQDIFICELISGGEDTDCLFSLFIDLRIHGLRGRIDGLSFGGIVPDGRRSLETLGNQDESDDETIEQFEVFEDLIEDEIDEELDEYDLPVEEEIILDEQIFLPLIQR